MEMVKVCPMKMGMSSLRSSPLQAPLKWNFRVSFSPIMDLGQTVKPMEQQTFSSSQSWDPIAQMTSMPIVPIPLQKKIVTAIAW